MQSDQPIQPVPKPTPALMARREQVITSLAAHFAADRLTLDQLEQRMDLAQRATTEAALDELLADLPATTAPAPVAASATRLADPANVRERQVLAAIMGGVERKGHWTPARNTLVVAFMGGAEIDLREAALPAEGVEIGIFAVWGGVEVIVPPEVHVDMSGLAIMGAFAQSRGTLEEPAPGAPVVKVSGFALMGGVDVLVRYPGETARDAKKRMKEELRRLKRGSPGSPP